MHASRRRLAIFPVLALALLASPAGWASDIRVGLPEAPDKAAGAIRLSTYNIENLFDADDDPALSGRYDDCHSYDKTVRAKPTSQLRAAARAIKELNADVIAFQEIESFDALNEFRITHLEGLGYRYIVSIDVGQERGIENAVISRYPIREATVWPNMPLDGVHPDKYGNRDNMYAGEPLVFRRSPLRVVVEVPSRDGGDPYELTPLRRAPQGGPVQRVLARGGDEGGGEDGLGSREGGPEPEHRGAGRLQRPALRPVHAGSDGGVEPRAGA